MARVESPNRFGLKSLTIRTAWALGCILLSGPGAAASEEPPEFIAPETSCTTSGCHAPVVAVAHKHWDEIDSQCNLCHQPEGSRHQFELPSSAEVCGQCHEKFFARLETFVKKHDDPDCTECHDPHGGAEPSMLLSEGRELCARCHRKIIRIVERAPVGHSPTGSGDECLNCHPPHGSTTTQLLRKDERQLCLDCHGEAIDSNGLELTNVDAHLKEYPEWHAPIREQGCTACHRPHGSKYEHLLRKRFPEPFYTSFDTKAYALCFKCHEESLATEENTQVLTGFRDGDRNLHFLHVNREKRGRSCRACHDAHSSDNTLLIRETVPYGRWNMPIRFEQSSTGGSCSPGCHSRKAYDREKQ